MATIEDRLHPDDGFYVVITGANSGIGLAIGCRLIENFVQKQRSQTLVLVVTTRSKSKGDSAIQQLRAHLDATGRKFEKRMPGTYELLQRRVLFQHEILGLMNLISIQKLCKRLHNTMPKLDVVICNAGIGGWDGLDWGLAIWSVLTDWKNAMMWPTFKKAGVGWVTKTQIPVLEEDKEVEEPSLGDVFCANLFGHYCLGHYLTPLLAKHDEKEQTRGRLIWVSSLEAYAQAFDIHDPQGPLLRLLVDQYFDHAKDTATTTAPRIYVAHPGICGTSIFALNVVLEHLMLFAMYIARWLGSEWHGVTAYKGACSMVWLALAEQSTLDATEAYEGVGNWGSAADWWGCERVCRTEVDGWGWGGILGEKIRKRGRHPYAKDLTEKDRQAFEDTGRICWVAMEKLRLEWETRLNDAGVSSHSFHCTGQSFAYTIE